jgi:endonuclease-3
MTQNKRKMREVLNFFKKRYGKSIENFTLKKRMDRKSLFRLLVTTILSQRAKDENTDMVSKRLFSVADTPEKMILLEKKKLEKIIYPSGPFRQKAERIIEISEKLSREYKNSFPRTREELLAFKGVGPKTADIILSYGYGKPVIAVDTHVEVVSKRLGLVREKAKYEEIRKTLENLTPPNKRFLVNLGFVNFGKEICITRKPKCEICPFTKFCRYYANNSLSFGANKK